MDPQQHVCALRELPDGLELRLEDGVIAQDDLPRLRKALIGKKPSKDQENTFKHLFPLLCDSAVNSTGVGSYRTLATDCLSISIQRATQSVDKGADLAEIVTITEINQLFEFVCDFWTDANPALGNALKDMFGKIIALAYKVLPAQMVTEMIGVWAVRVMKMPKSMRVVYFVLEIITKSVGGSFILAQDEHFVEEALGVMGSVALANPVGKTLYAIFSSIRTQIREAHVYDNSGEGSEITNWVELWAPPVRERMTTDMTLQKHILLYFLPQMFKFHPDCFPVFMLSTFGDLSRALTLSEIQLEALVGCLKIGQEIGLIEVGSSEFLQVDMVRNLLQHESMSLRAAALSLLLNSPKGSEAVKPYVYEVLRNVLPDLFAEGDAEFRNKVYSYMRQFTTRVRDSSYALQRDIGRMESKLEKLKGEEKEKLQAKMEDYVVQVEAAHTYSQWLVDFITAQLNPCAPYQTFHTALRLIPMLIHSGLDKKLDQHIIRKNYLEFPFQVEIFTPLLVERLIDGVTSNYEDLRQMCVVLLKMSPTECFPNNEITVLADRGMTMMAGIRGREGDSGARLTQFVFNLYGRTGQQAQIQFFERLLTKVEEFLVTAESNLTLAVKEYPVHGYFSALRFILEDVVAEGYNAEWLPCVNRALKNVHYTWDLTKAILTDDSPEGNVPEELNDVEDIELKYGPASQLVLSYAWRAVKESTAMMGSILALVSDISDQTILECGNLSIEQLATVRHRGAFSSVYPTFVACCKRCAKTDTLKGKPEEWLNYNIDLIEKMAQKITRRSGGLPYLIAGVLCAESDEDRPLLKHTFEELLQIANKPLDADATIAQIPQVHALNCMRILFIESDLSEASAHYIDEGLQLSIERFSSPTWAVRNCAVMLYTSLQNRLFGTKRVATVVEGSNLSRNNTGTVPARLFFTRYKNIREILLQHLRDHVDSLDEDSTALETTYPVLSLLSRLEGTNGYEGLDEFRTLIKGCLRSKVWKIREVAARTYAFMTADDLLFDSVSSLAETLPDTSQNYTHGCLLAIDATLARATIKLPHKKLPQQVLQKLYALFTPLLKQNPCPATQIAYFRILKNLYQKDSKAPFSGRLVQFSLTQIEQNFNGKLDAAARVLRQECVYVLLKYSSDSGLGPGIFVSYVRQLFSDSTYEVVQTTIATIEERLGEFDQETKCSILESLWDLTRVSHCDLVKGPALRLLSTLLKDTPSTLSDSLCQSLLFSYTNEHSTDISESALGALGPFTARVNDAAKTRKWLSLVKKYADETAAFSSRQAALRSLCAYLRVKSTQNDTSDETMQSYILLLLYLSDDDINLREMAAHFTSKELCGLPFASTNVRAEKALLEKLNNENRVEFTPHLTSLLEGYTSLPSQIDAALADDSFLFSTERQNVYRNEPVLLSTVQGVLAEGPAPEGSSLEGWLKPGLEHWKAKKEELEKRPELKTEYNFFLVKARTDLAEELSVKWGVEKMEV
ncbi:putative death-receptor fusion protein-domain-containing protein [Yarrowia lipolytica]|nr:putative death-receptor fusion protein-domain-containing protein [Yarrowia lipolytica]RDW50864.1 putative death-receptor fusion protein-domain-containing protein [Yarrowia lipolytica]